MWIIVAFVGVLMGASLPFLHEAISPYLPISPPYLPS